MVERSGKSWEDLGLNCDLCQQGDSNATWELNRFIFTIFKPWRLFTSTKHDQWNWGTYSEGEETGTSASGPALGLCWAKVTENQTICSSTMCYAILFIQCDEVANKELNAYLRVLERGVTWKRKPIHILINLNYDIWTWPVVKKKINSWDNSPQIWVYLGRWQPQGASSFECYIKKDWRWIYKHTYWKVYDKKR